MQSSSVDNTHQSPRSSHKNSMQNTTNGNIHTDSVDNSIGKKINHLNARKKNLIVNPSSNNNPFKSTKNSIASERPNLQQFNRNN